MRLRLLLGSALVFCASIGGCVSRAENPDGSSASSGGSATTGPSSGGASGVTAGSTAAGGSVVNNGNCPAPGTFMLNDLEKQEHWGFWFTTNDQSPGATQTPSGAFQPELSPDLGSQAVHTTGDGYLTWGAGVGLNLDGVKSCFDMAQTQGFSFKAKGPGTLVISAVVSGTTPVASGGTCVENCYDSFKVYVNLDSIWLEYNLDWNAMRQDGWGTPVQFMPQDVMALQFTAGPTQMPFDFWLDDVKLREGTYMPGTGGSTGSGGSTGTGGTGPDIPIEGTLSDVLSADLFNQMFPDRNWFYTYEGLIEAGKQFPAFASQGSLETRKREVAAFLANVSWETGGLVHIEEISPPSIYCQANEQYPCAGGQSYHGRGPMQISWNYNYGAAGNALGLDLLSNPGLVASDAAVAWETAIWFWMTSRPLGKTAHQVMLDNDGFGSTIRIINGAIECDGGNWEAVNGRASKFQSFTSLLGVSAGENLTC